MHRALNTASFQFLYIFSHFFCLCLFEYITQAGSRNSPKPKFRQRREQDRVKQEHQRDKTGNTVSYLSLKCRISLFMLGVEKKLSRMCTSLRCAEMYPFWAISQPVLKLKCKLSRWTRAGDSIPFSYITDCAALSCLKFFLPTLDHFKYQSCAGKQAF